MTALAVTFLCLAYLLECQAIKCYKCLNTLPPYYTNETINFCKDFDYSDRYIVDCPFSTFCLKRITSAKIPLPINGTERDCASQKHETQNYKNGKWQTDVTIEEPYEEGCKVLNDKGLRTSRIEDCYCKGELCNTASTPAHIPFTLILTILVYRWL